MLLIEERNFRFMTNMDWRNFCRESVNINKWKDYTKRERGSDPRVHAQYTKLPTDDELSKGNERGWGSLGEGLGKVRGSPQRTHSVYPVPILSPALS